MPHRPTITVDRIREAFSRFSRPRTEETDGEERVDTGRVREARDRVEEPDGDERS